MEPQIIEEQPTHSPLSVPMTLFLMLFLGAGLLSSVFLKPQPVINKLEIAHGQATDFIDPNPFIPDYSKPFQKGREDYFGTVTLTGYLVIKDSRWTGEDPDPDYKGEPYKSASFHFSEADNEFLYTYLHNNSENSYLDEDSIGLGCYDPIKAVISSFNSGDTGSVDSMIKDEDLKLLLASSKTNPVKLRVAKSYVSSGKGAPMCYSFFRNFKIVTSQATSTLDTSTWKTYRNNQYGFEFSYPEKYFLNERKGDGSDSSFEGRTGLFVELSKESDGADYIITFNTNTNCSSANEVLVKCDLTRSDKLDKGVYYKTDIDGGVIYDLGDVSIAGKKAIKILTCRIGCGISYFLKENNSLFSIDINADDTEIKDGKPILPENNIGESIVQTFKLSN